MLLLLTLACDLGGDTGEPSTLLDESFPTRLTERYACDIGWYVAYDEDRTIRVQTGFVTEYGEDPGIANEGPIDGVTATFQVYTGECLWTPGCTDDWDGLSCGNQTIAHQYVGVSGTLALAADPSGVAGAATDLVLEGTDGEDRVSLDALDLPHAAFWTEGSTR